jgi:hypothetical protein
MSDGACKCYSGFTGEGCENVMDEANERVLETTTTTPATLTRASTNVATSPTASSVPAKTTI